MARQERTTSWIDWFLFGHFWIALSAAGLAWTTAFLTTGQGQLEAWHALVFSATLALYNWHRIFSFSRKGAKQDAPRYILVLFYPVLCRIIAAAASITAFILAITQDTPWAIVGFGLFLAVGYVLPANKAGSGWLRKNYFKPIVVATGWSVITAALPLYYCGNLAIDWTTLLILIERFSFTLCVAICFDWRDREIDQQQGIKTLAQRPLYWSKSSAAAAVSSSVIATSLLIYLGKWNTYSGALIFSYILAFILVNKLNQFKGDYKFAWLYNGLLATPPAFIWLLIISPWARSKIQSIIHLLF